MRTTDGSRSISSYIDCLMASRKVTCAGASPPLLEAAFFAGAVEVFAMDYLRPFFAAVFAAGFFADLAGGFAADFFAADPTIGATTFAIFFRTGATFLKAGLAAGFLPVPFFEPFFAFGSDFGVALRDGFITSSVTTSSGVSGESFSSTSLRSSLCAVSPKWIGATPPPELFPRPNPSTTQLASMLALGGITSDLSRSHFGAILWQSSPVQ